MTHSNPQTHIHRQNRAENDEAWIKTFLRDAPYGVIASTHEGQPFVHPNLFVYDEPTHAIYFHTAEDGRTSDNIRSNRQVSFVTSRIGRLLPAARSCDFSVEYASVVVFGHARILESVEERRYGLQRLNDKYFPHLRPGLHYPELDEDQMRGTAVYRLDITGWSAKRKQAPDDFPGAFTFKARSE